MFILPLVTPASLISSNLLAISTGGSRPVKGSTSGASWSSLGSDFAQSLNFAGGAFGEAVVIGNEAFVCNANGELYKTTNFKTFTRINIQSIISGNAPNFSGQALLFKDPSFPNRLYASALSSFVNATGLWYSDDLGLNWTMIAIMAGSSTNITNWVIIGDYFYTGISVSGNSGVTLYRFNRTNLAQNMQVSNSVLPNLGWLYTVNNNRLLALNGSLYWTDNPVSGANFVPLPSSFSGYCMTGRLIGGSLRHAMIGRRSDTGRLAIIYTGASPESGGWQYATVPNIGLDNASIRYMKIISLIKGEGFVASYVDSFDGTLSGILYSADGITWTEVLDASLTNYINITNNPLVV